MHHIYIYMDKIKNKKHTHTRHKSTYMQWVAYDD